MGTRCANHVTPLYPQKLALISPTGGGRSVGMVRSRTKATEFSFLVLVTLHPLKPVSIGSLFENFPWAESATLHINDTKIAACAVGMFLLLSRNSNRWSGETAASIIRGDGYLDDNLSR